MKTAVRQSSIETYHAIQRDGSLTRQQAAIMDCISDGRDYSLKELVRITGLEINVISARINELVSAKRLERNEKTRPCSITKRSIHPVRLPAKQFPLFEEAA